MMTDILDELHDIAERIAALRDRPEIVGKPHLADLAESAQEDISDLYQAVGRA